MLSFPCVCQAPASTRFPSHTRQRDSGFLYLCPTSLFSNACALLSTTGNTHLLSLQSLPHSFHHDGGYTPLSHFGTHAPPSIHLSFQRLTHDPFCRSFPLAYIHLMGVWGNHMVTGTPVNSGPSISLAAPFAVQPILLSGRHSPRLYSLLRRTPLLEVAKSTLLILSALFPVVNPLGGSPVFLALTREYPASARRI